MSFMSTTYSIKINMNISPTRQRILDELPATPPQLCIALGISPPVIFANLMALHEAKLIHVIDHPPSETGRGPRSRLYASGPGIDVKRPPIKRVQKVIKRDPVRTAAAVLAAMPGTCGSIARGAGLSVSCVVAQVARLVADGKATGVGPKPTVYSRVNA